MAFLNALGLSQDALKKNVGKITQLPCLFVKGLSNDIQEIGKSLFEL